jgi:hypothetical protein
MLWFVFWQNVPVGSEISPEKTEISQFAGGVLSHGVGFAILGLVLAALLCHFLFFLVPGLLGLRTGLPLYIVGTSTYGVRGGFYMPGFLMGLLQFGWLGVNSFFAGALLCAPFGYGPLTFPHAVVSSIWAIAAAFVGLKGIQYVARVATFFPLIPLTILVVLFVASLDGLGSFDAESLVQAGVGRIEEVERESEFVLQRVAGEDPLETPPEGDRVTRVYATEWVEVEKVTLVDTKRELTLFAVIALICTYVVGFFATAGAAGVDFGMNNRNAKDVHFGGLVGIALATILAGGLALLITAGAHGKQGLPSQPAVDDQSSEGEYDEFLGDDSPEDDEEADDGDGNGGADEEDGDQEAPAGGTEDDEEDADDEAAEEDEEENGEEEEEFDVAVPPAGDEEKDQHDPGVLQPTKLMAGLVGEKWSEVFMYLLALAAFPPACFSSFIAANSFKTTLPRVSPFFSVGCGTCVSIFLAVSALAGNVIGMFNLIGAAFGPVCGAMAADYLLAGRKWAGPRAGFNLAGWISWIVGFLVGAAGFIPGTVRAGVCPPVAAFLVGFVLYYALAKLGLEGETLAMPGLEEEAAEAPSEAPQEDAPEEPAS